MRLEEFAPVDEDLSRRGFLQGLGAAAATAATGAQAKFQPTPNSAPAPHKVVDTPATRTLIDIAKKYIKNPTELAQFMAQCAHETANFTTLSELGGPEHFKHYDPQFNPSKARQLGNTQPGDGERYKGRGFLQLTGRDNYRRAGQAIGVDLEKHPEWLENQLKIAAYASVWFWLTQVRNKVKNFGNVKQSTKPINPALRGLDDRKQKFANYQAAMKPIKVASR